MKTEDLIQKLCIELSPVKRIYPASITFAGWILFTLISGMLFIGSQSANFQLIHFPTYSYELIIIILYMLSSAYFAIYFSIPGNRKNKMIQYLPVAFLLLWILSIIVRHFWVSSDTHEMQYDYHRCARDLFLMSLPSSSVLIYIINRRIPIRKKWIGFWILSASTSASAVGISLLCPNEIPYHLLTTHVFPAIAMSLIGIFLGKALFKEV